MRSRLYVLVSIVLGGCLSLPSSDSRATIKLTTDTDAMKAEVLRYIHIGMPIEEAKKTMEAQGFKAVQDDWSRFWLDDEQKADEQKAKLVFSKFVPQRSWVESLVRSDEVRIRVFYDAGRVTNVSVRHLPCCL